MDNDTLKRIERVFHEAIQRRATERAAYLDEACGEDRELRGEIEALLRHHTGTGTLLDVSGLDIDVLARIGDLADDLLRAWPEAGVEGRVFGPYRLEREIGRGGMGRVFLAEREDLPKRVALKVVREPLATPDCVRRFRQEERVLAGLDHPHIAQLLDAGVTDDGSPWFAMEYIDGESIVTYCDTTRRSVEQRLRLFLSVCSAVRYAHGNLVVHRDIKPSNVMVTQDGRPKLLDFGVAKLLDPVGAGEPTRTFARAFTPAYAAPEQLAGERISTVTDVYQLGALLYELLVGRPPLDLTGKSAAQAERLVCEADPAPPSSVIARAQPDDGADRSKTTNVCQARSVTPERLQRRLRGDVDRIVLMALEKRTDRRYPSVEAFADDIERFLDGRPVLARPATLRYRTGRFVSRHWAGVATAAGFILLLVASVLLLALEQSRTARERDRATAAAATAEQEAAKSQQVTEYLVGLFEGADPGVAQGDTITARELLARGVAQADRLEDQPRVQASLLGAMGRIHYDLGNLRGAESLLRRALGIWETLGTQPEQEDERKRTVWGLARALAKQERYAEAEPLLRDIAAQAVVREGEDEIDGRALFDLYGVLHAMDRMEAADSVFAEWDAAYAESFSPSDRETADRMFVLGQNLGYRGQIRGDRESIRRGQTLIRSVAAALRDTHGPRHPSVGEALNELANLLMADLALSPASQPVDSAVIATADSVTREVLQLHRAIYAEPSVGLHQSLSYRASALVWQERYDEAEAAIREALAIAENLAGTSSGMLWVNDMESLGAIALAKGDAEGAIAHYAEVRDWWARSYGDEYLLTLTSELDLGRALTRGERFAEAEARLTSAYDKLSTQRGHADRYTQAALGHLVDLYERWDRPARAASFRALLTTNGPDGR